MDEIIRKLTDKVGLSPDVARGVVEKVLGFLKTHLPESVASKLNSALGGQLDGVPEASGGLAEEVGQTGVPIDKVPGTLDAVTGWLKDKLPEGVRDEVTKALTPGGDILGKVSGWLGGNKG
jgi:hypothetical protein